MRNKDEHLAYKRPESVLVVVYTEAGEFLLMERRQPAGFWQSVTGSLEWHETPDAAAERELLEETGLQQIPLDLNRENHFPILPAWRSRYHPEVQENREYLFALKLSSVCNIQLNPDEHVRYAWLDAHTAMARCGSWTNRDAIRWLSEKLGA
ncbi:MAG: dihydroneopterin triphosphate diphosphatase [Gammaproteobacteria bacterium]|nr:MAG: dihydroneopterin triphosphate diphosphatase [Gammaproteobacteria bacterium]